jgi:hypothetical protein
VTTTTPLYAPVFTPVFWALPHPGTNGHITSWGAMLAGFPPSDSL